MNLPRLGHAVVRVRSLERSLPFYREVLGLREVARHGEDMAFLSFGDSHHDLALLQVGEAAAKADPRAVGLHHLAFKVGDGLAALRDWRDRLQAMGVAILGQSDHRVSQSLYLRDPDGILLELYVDADPALWREDPSAVAHVGPLDL